MSSSSDTLQFRFASHGDSVLAKMNALREDRRFCDVTLLLGGPLGSVTTPPLRFHGHRVVLAASSDFLRDQFLLHESRQELNVSVVPNVEIGRRLLLSCYTGLLEVPLRELVNYLTAASALQMSQVVERCAQAVSKYLSPTLAHLKLEKRPGEEREESQKPDSPRLCTSLLDRAERAMAKPSTSFQDKGVRSTGPRELGSIKLEWTVAQSEMVDSEGTGEARKAEQVVRPKVELAKIRASSLETEDAGGENQEVHTNSPSYPQYQLTGAHRRKQRPPTPFRDQPPLSPYRENSVHQLGVPDSSQDQGEQEGEGPREEEEVYMRAEGGDSSDASLLRLTGVHLSGPHLPDAERSVDIDSLVVQRPYLCRRCDRVFQHLESYVGHLKEHRQYMCLLCGKSFSQKSNLTRHVRVHTGVKPFRCPLCHKTFSQKATLQDHLNLHTGDKPHKCNYCAMHFAHKPGLRRHLKDIHGKSSLQNVFEEIVD